ncbi:exosortase O [Merismopedia glauca]|uniref:Exosortase O n=1 Tax=Merismopedia glauca CCAP 1448/3 TaxID=1296344 RepID=A0A2T1C1N6_9CYAN|nr:exosortase O [Merismopedia glauca]PSB02152.1 exosortase O [Merismopedia glauca CCAP 1448/3]
MLTKTRTLPWEIHGNSLGGIALAIWWFYVNISSVEWLFTSLNDTSLFNLVLITLVVVGLGILGFWQRQQLSFSPIPQWNRLPVRLILGTGVGGIVLRWSVDIPHLSVILFLIGTYGLLGLFINPKIWRSGLAVAVLFSVVFPFSLPVSVGVGFPIRVMTAYAVEHLLTNWGLPATSSHDIILLEGKVAYVDLPCSGLKSLWTGTLFLLAATWLENRLINWRWLGILLIHILLLIGANIGRVTVLVLINNVLKQPEVAHIVHFPMGIVGFSTACLISWWLLRGVERNEESFGGLNWSRFRSRQGVLDKDRWLLAKVAQKADREVIQELNWVRKTGVILFLTGLVLIPQPLPSQSQVLDVKGLNLPGIIQSQDLPLTEFESNFFDGYKDTQAVKKKFKIGDLSGSLLLVSTTSWQAHHAPELCLIGNGLEVDEMTKKRLAKDVNGRWLSLNNNRASATYWFQSPHRTTDEFLDRFWSDVTRQEKSWTLVSVLFDRSISSDAPEVKTLVDDLHQSLIALQ